MYIMMIACLSCLCMSGEQIQIRVAIWPVDRSPVCNVITGVAHPVCLIIRQSSSGLIPTQFSPHQTLGLFQIDANTRLLQQSRVEVALVNVHCLCTLMLTSVCVHRISVFVCGCVWYYSIITFISA